VGIFSNKFGETSYRGEERLKPPVGVVMTHWVKPPKTSRVHLVIVFAIGEPSFAMYLKNRK
jgi:hypothetical protein